MDRKAVLLSYFLRYGEEGARCPSARGCYEMAVPDALVKAVAEKGNDQNRKGKNK